MPFLNPLLLDDIENHHIITGDDFKDFFDNAHDLIHMAHRDGALFYVNHSWMKTLEYTQSEIVGKSFYSFMEEPDRSRFIEYRNSIVNGLPVSEADMQFTLKTKSGKNIKVEGSISAREKNGEPMYTRGIFHDITAKFENEKRLREYYEELQTREYNLQQLLFQAPDPVIVIDIESNIVYWNPKAETVFGWSAAEVTGKSLAEFIIPVQYREAHKNGMQRYLQTGETRVLNKTIEITAMNKKGSEFYVALTISKSQQLGKIVFIAFLRDISEQKTQASELEKLIDALKRSNANLEEFAYAASHDLNEPIRKIKILADRLRGSLLSKMDDNESHLFSRMENATRRMGMLTKDLLEYSQVHVMPVEMESINLNEKIQKILNDLEEIIEEKNANIKVGELPVVKGYRIQLQQLFQNLISNAIKYTKPGYDPVIRITASLIKGDDLNIDILEAEKNKYFHVIQVSDEGIGFDPKNATRIFSMFQRLHGKEEYPGTGVGLSIARKVVENHNGHIIAESEPGKGTAFKVFLPVA